MLRILGFGLALLVAGCGGGDEVPSTNCGDGAGADQGKESEPTAAAVCEAGKVEACPCAGTTDPGTQACADDGSKWETCACPDPVALSPSALCTGVLTPAETSVHCPSGYPKRHKYCPDLLIENQGCKATEALFCCRD